MMGLKRRGLGRRSSESRVHGTLELGNRITLALVDFGSCVIVFFAKVDESGSVRNLLSCASLFDKVDNILFDLAVLEGNSDLLAGLE